MRFQLRLLVITAVLLSFYVVFAPNIKAADCVPKTANWNQITANIGSSADLIIGGDAGCMGKTATIELWEQGLNAKIGTLFATFNTSGVSVAAVGRTTWTITSNGIDNSRRNQNSPWNNVYGFYFYVRIDGASWISNTLQVPIPNSVKTGGLAINYNVTPTSVTSPGSITLRVTFKVHFDYPDVFKTYCQTRPLPVSLYKSSSGAELPELSVPVLDYFDITSVKDYDFSYSRTDNYVAGLNQTGSYLGRVLCSSTIVAESQPISFSVNTTGTGIPGPGGQIWACIADDGKYACSPGNKQDLSDVPNDACKGKTAQQIQSSQCSPATGGTPGQDQTYIYKIENPLAGGPQTPFDVINIASRWLLNISIPLAVMFILYAGFLMLTAGPNPGKGKQARTIIWNVVLALAIIFIGRGFITLIKSVIELGGGGS